MEEKRRKAGTQIIGDVPWGTHICQFYQTKEDLLDILVPYFKAGLENNEFCMWITSEPLKVEDAKSALKKVVKNLDHFIKKGQIEILDYSEWYTKSGKFNANNVLQGWVEKENQALKRGYDGLRLSGNTFWLAKGDWRNFTDYEEEVNKVIAKYRMIAICNYSLDKCGASEVTDVVSNHQFALIRQEGEWVTIESSEHKRAEGEYRTILKTAMDGFWITDMQGRFLDINDAYCRLIGYDRNELLTMRISDVEAAERPEETVQHIKKIMEVGWDRFETRHRCKDGRIVDVEISVNYIDAGGGQLFVFARDITERKWAENELRKFKTISDKAGYGVSIVDLEGNVIYNNTAYGRMHGYTPGELIGKHLSIFHTEQQMANVNRLIEQLNREGSYVAEEVWHKRNDNTEFPILMNGTLVKDENGTPLFMAATAIDITERKRVEEALREEQGTAQKYLDVAGVMLVAINTDGKVTLINRKGCEILGYKEEEIIGKNWFDNFLPERVREKVKVTFSKLIAGKVEPLEYFENAVLTRSGEEKIIAWHNTILTDEKVNIIASLSSGTDITERKRVEEALRRKSGEQGLLLDNIQTQVWYLTDEETYGAVNKARAEFFGKKNGEMENKKFYDVLSKDEAEICMSGYVEVFEKRKQIHTEEWITNAKGEKRLLSIIKSPKLDENGDVEYVVCSAEDITERKRAEDEIKKMNEELERRVIERTAQLEATNEELQFLLNIHSQTEEELMKYEKRLEELVERRTERIRELERQRTEIEKLAAAGLMAARIAHEINNPLAGIKNSFMLVKDAVPEDHPYYAYVGRIDNEINRIARIVRQMFDVYRPEQEIKKEFSVDKTLYEVVVLLEAARWGNNITIEIDSKPITMEMPEGLLRQVLYNILVNAIEASPQGGVVKIMTEVNNEILTLSISDQGVGIPLEVQPRIFEPFFTSKQGSQKGLGLGLAVSKDIVEKLGGHIYFESEPGKGTLFRIILPLKSGERR